MHSPARSRYIPAAAILLILLLSTPITKAQQTITVPASQPTIQAAINAANNGDTVMVAPGTYVENINFNGKAITVTSSGGPTVTTIDGGAQASVVTFSTGETASSVLSGFTIRNGLNAIWGGGIYISSASPTITGNVITANHASVGCGIYVNGGSPLIQNNTITANDQTGAGDGGQGGGGILVSGGSSSPANPQIIGNTITNNSVAAGGDGGGISVGLFSSPLIQGNLIQGNRAYNFGGGVALESYNSPVLVQNLIVNNVSLAGGSGGGLYVSPSSDPTQTSVTNNTIVGNSAYDATSGIDVGGFGQHATFTNNLIVAAAGQNAVSCISLYSYVSPVFSYNDGFAPSGSAWAGICDTTSNPGNISADPLFMSPANNDFHLQAASPAVNSGSNSAASLPNTDFDGNPRIAGAAVDLGVYEVAPTSAANISPAGLSFGLQAPGTTSGPQTATLTSTGTTPFQITSIQITGAFSASTTCPTLKDPAGFSGIPAGNNCAYSVTFAPPSGASPGTLTGTLTVNGTNGASLAVSLSGTVPTVPATLSPSSLSFASQLVGTTSNAQAVTLTNPGNVSLAITSITASQQFSESDNCGASLAAGASCTINVTFAPTSAGNMSGTLTVTDNAANSPQSVTLSGTGLAPAAVSMSPSSLTFPDTQVGSTSAPQTITLTNTGGASLNISVISYPPSFILPNQNCLGTLAGGASCQMSVAFKPTTGGPVSGSLQVTDSASDSPQSVALSGNGIAPPPAVSLSPSSLTFPDTQVGSTSAPQTITLTNTGGSNLNIPGMSYPNGFILPSQNCLGTLAAGASCQISVAFKPTTGGAFSGNLQITDNASNSPQSLALSGNGIAPPPAVSLSPSSLNFGSQLIGTTTTQTVTLTNTGGSSMNISSLSYPNPFSVPSTNCLGPLGAGASCQISVAFKPTARGPASGVLQITDTASGSPHSVPLSGTGLAPAAVSFNMPAVGFAPQIVGTTSISTQVILSNSGDLSLNITGISTTSSFGQTNNCPPTLAAGANCAIYVTFTPQASGQLTGTLSVVDSATGSPHTLSLNGTGVDFTVGANPTALNVNAGASVSTTVFVNAAGGAFNQSVSLSCSGLPAFSSCSFSPAALAPGNGGASSSLQIQASKRGGSRTPAGTYTITISGTAGNLVRGTTVTLIVH